jgi:hypothetical protein
MVDSLVEAPCWVTVGFLLAYFHSFGGRAVEERMLGRVLERVFLTTGASSRYSGGRAVVEVVHRMFGMVQATVFSLTAAYFH